MKKYFLGALSLICMIFGSQKIYSQISSNYLWTEKGQKYTSVELVFDIPQGLSEGYSSYDLSLNGSKGINIINNLGIEMGVGLIMNSLHTESTLKNHSEYIKTTKEWFRWTTGEEASSNTSFAFQLMPGIRYSINDINLKASMGFAKALKGGFNQISSSGNISIGYSILHKQNFVLYPSIGYIFGIGEKYKDYGAVQFKIGIEGPFI